MDTKTTEALQKAFEFLKAGNKRDAYVILKPIVETDQNIAEAWYLLAFTFTDSEKRMFAFQQVLRIDPNNPAAHKQVDKLLARSAASVAPVKKEPKKHVASMLIWGLSGIVGLLLFLVLVGGLWLAQIGLPVVQAAAPTMLSNQPTSLPTASVFPSATNTAKPVHTATQMVTATSMPLATATQTVFVNPTLDATPNLAVFKNIFSDSSSDANAAMSLDGPAWELGNKQGSLTTAQSGHLNAGEATTLLLNIDTTSETTFYFQSTVAKDSTFTLTDPDGQLIDQDYVDKHANDVEFGNNSFFAMKFYKFKKTRPGTWKLNITAIEAGNYKVFAVLVTGLTINAGSDKHAYNSGDIATFAAQLKDGNKGLPAGSVNLTLGLDNGSVEIIPLNDYGNGVYAATYTIPDSTGFVSATVTAKFNYNGIETTREIFFMFMVSPSDIKLTGEYSDKLGYDEDGNKTIDAQVGIASGRTGDFNVYAQLISGDQIISTATTSATFLAGHNNVTISFSGQDIQHFRLDGPYTIKVLSIGDIHNGTYINVENNTWQTAEYSWRDFGSEICYSLKTPVDPENAGSVEISPASNCPDGKYLSNTEITLKAIVNAGFQFTGWNAAIGGVNSSLSTITFKIQRDTFAIATFEKTP